MKGGSKKLQMCWYGILNPNPRFKASKWKYLENFQFIKMEYAEAF